MTNPNQPLYSMHITNNVGCPTRPSLLVVNEYDHWKIRMESFLTSKEKEKKYRDL